MLLYCEATVPEYQPAPAKVTHFMEVINCELCGSRDRLRFLQRDGFQIVRCHHCSLLYVSPRPTEEEIRAYYPEEYYAYLVQQSSGLKKAMESIRLQVKRIVYRRRYYPQGMNNLPGKLFYSLVALVFGVRLRRKLPAKPKGRLLDVGCGNGQWIHWLGNALPNWDVYGVEVNPKASDYARNAFGLKVTTGQLLDTRFPEAYFDAVTMWQSLEHIHRSVATLREVRRILVDDGWLIIEIPNIASLEAKLFRENWYHLTVPLHLFHYSPETISRMLAKCGFTIRAIEKTRGRVGFLHGINRWRRESPGLVPLLLTLTYPALWLTSSFSAWGLRIYAAKDSSWTEENAGGS